jgi:enoyl-CoA hydratase
MGSLVRYEWGGSIATITLDDGKVNVMSVAMQEEIHAALDRATADKAVVLLSGRAGVFSAGFDLKALRSGGKDAATMVRGGFELAERILSFPLPVVMACTGHAIAMGAFLLLSGDYRVGAEGAYKVTANEVAIGLTLPRAAVEILRQRLTPSCFNRAVVLAEVFSPANAVEAGFFDTVVEGSRVLEAAFGVAGMAATLDLKAHAASKLRAREATLKAIRTAIEADEAELHGHA